MKYFHIHSDKNNFKEFHIQKKNLNLTKFKKIQGKNTYSNTSIIPQK